MTTRNSSVGSPETVLPRRPWQGVSDVRVDAHMQGYETGFNDAREELQDILASLIAELRSEHYPHACTDPEDYPCCCQECRQQWPCSIEASARSAEARLREVTDE